MSGTAETSRTAEVGLLEWFWFDDRAAVERALVDLARLNVRQLRIGISWADYLREGGQAWYDWLLPTLAAQVELLPCVLYTPPSLAEIDSTAAPPRVLKDYADFIDTLISRYGAHFEYLELWNEPNNVREWDCTLDWTWEKFSTMIQYAAHWARQRGKKTVLGGMSPIDPNWLHTMGQLGVLQHIDVIGVHAFPGSFDAAGEDWQGHLAAVRQVLAVYDCQAPLWLTETGYSTWQHDEFGQLKVLDAMLELPVERIYWLSLYDLPARRPSLTGLQQDVRDYHFGLKREHGQEKLLYRAWVQGGLEQVREMARWTPHPASRPSHRPPVLITGGAGFVGANLAERIASEGRTVRVFDNLGRPGVERNLAWLRERHPQRVEFWPGDVRNPAVLAEAVAGVDQIFHLAAQVAVTTSLSEPVEDFEINLRGTLNLLEAARAQPVAPSIVFSSTNKVYGSLPDVPLMLDADAGWQPREPGLRAHGVAETRPLDFHSPYGCSKGGADQYLLDYARCMGVPATVFRMSCIYGPRQFGTEDQGWVAHFLIRAARGEPITLYGDGHQVRDILFVEDLVAAFLAAERAGPTLSGQAFNIGGGPANAISLRRLLGWIEAIQGRPVTVSHEDWRPGDQRYYVSDTRRFTAATGWRPTVEAADGVRRLAHWLAGSYVLGNELRQPIARQAQA